MNSFFLTSLHFLWTNLCHYAYNYFFVIEMFILSLYKVHFRFSIRTIFSLVLEENSINNGKQKQQKESIERTQS